MKTSVYIIGAGGHAQQVIDVFESTHNINIAGFFDDSYPHKKYVNGTKYPIIDIIENIAIHIDEKSNLFCSIGDNHTRKQICNRLNKYNFVNCTSPYAKISNNASIVGTGNYIGHNVIISGGTIIDSYNILNDGCVIPHDCSVGNFNHISINAVLGGGVRIGDLNLLGLNCTILPKISIGNKNLIGASTIITKNIHNNSKYIGNPGLLRVATLNNID